MHSVVLRVECSCRPLRMCTCVRACGREKVNPPGAPILASGRAGRRRLASLDTELRRLVVLTVLPDREAASEIDRCQVPQQPSRQRLHVSRSHAAEPILRGDARVGSLRVGMRTCDFRARFSQDHAGSAFSRQRHDFGGPRLRWHGRPRWRRVAAMPGLPVRCVSNASVQQAACRGVPGRKVLPLRGHTGLAAGDMGQVRPGPGGTEAAPRPRSAGHRRRTGSPPARPPAPRRPPCPP